MSSSNFEIIQNHLKPFEINDFQIAGLSKLMTRARFELRHPAKTLHRLYSDSDSDFTQIQRLRLKLRLKDRLKLLVKIYFHKIKKQTKNLDFHREGRVIVEMHVEKYNVRENVKIEFVFWPRKSFRYTFRGFRANSHTYTHTLPKRTEK